MKTLLLFLNFVISGCCFAQLPAAVRTGVYRNEQTNALHVAANQAALGHFETFAAAIYGEKRFLMQELSLFQMAFVQPAGNGAFGLQFLYSGDANYNLSKLGFAYGRKLGERVEAGVQFNYLDQHIRGYNNAAQVTVEGGMLFHLSETLHAGFQLSNPAGVVLNKSIEKISAIYTAGVTYQPSKQFGITTELIKTSNAPIALQTGFEYKLSEKIWSKAGINSSTTAFYIAAGFQLKHFSIEAVGSVHPQLGFSPGLLLLYNGMGK